MFVTLIKNHFIFEENIKKFRPFNFKLYVIIKILLDLNLKISRETNHLMSFKLLNREIPKEF